MRAKDGNRLLDHVRDHAAAGDAASVIDAIDDYSRRNGGMIHLGRNKGAIFDRVVRQSGASRVLEFGTNYGYSALRLAGNLTDKASITTIELDRNLADTAAAIFAHAGLDHRIMGLCGRAGDMIDQFSEPFDLIFIDHYPDNYFTDLQKLERLGLVGDGATLITDNVVIFETRLKRYLDHLRHGGDYDSTLHQPSPESDGIEVSIRRAGSA